MEKTGEDEITCTFDEPHTCSDAGTGSCSV